MWVQKRKDGYQFRQSYTDPTNRKRRTVTVTFGKNNAQTRKRAQIYLDQEITKRLTELQGGETDVTFGEMIPKYLKLAEQQLAYGTYYRRQKFLDKFEEEVGADTIMRKLTTTFFNKYFDEKLYDKDKPVTNETIRAYRANLSVVYDYAIKYGYLKSNPLTQVSISYKNERARKQAEIESKYLTDEEVSKILDYCKEQKRPDLYDFFSWLFMTGMRAGEAAVIQKKNILQDKDGYWYARVNGTLEVRRNESDLEKKYRKTNSAKTFSGNRDVLLPPEAVKIAKEHCKGKKANDYIFRNKWKTSNGYFQPVKLNRVLKTACVTKGISKDVTTHFFRHTHVSKLAEQGVPLYVIQKRVGHGDSRITQRIYLHVTDSAKSELEQKLSNFARFTHASPENEENNSLKIVKK